jgi:hypothetical protein
LKPNRLKLSKHRIKAGGFPFADLKSSNTGSGRLIHSISNIEKVRHVLSDKEQIKINHKPDADQELQCPSCQVGTMITVLIIDGCGNVVMDGLPDPVKESEIKVDNSS